MSQVTVATCVEIDRLARYLANEHRTVDMMLNDGSGCEPYPTWDESLPPRQEVFRQKAISILRGEVDGS